MMTGWKGARRRASSSAVGVGGVEGPEGAAEDVPQPLRAVISITAATIKAASVVVATVPILCVYPFVQKYFVKGVMIGGVKG